MPRLEERRGSEHCQPDTGNCSTQAHAPGTYSARQPTSWRLAIPTESATKAITEDNGLQEWLDSTPIRAPLAVGLAISSMQRWAVRIENDAAFNARWIAHIGKLYAEQRGRPPAVGSVRRRQESPPPQRQVRARPAEASRPNDRARSLRRRLPRGSGSVELIQARRRLDQKVLLLQSQGREEDCTRRCSASRRSGHGRADPGAPT